MKDERQVVVVPPDLDRDQLMFTRYDGSPPFYSVSEASRFFFGLGAHWLRWRDRKGDLVLDGAYVGGQRTAKGARRYTLADIERIGHALAQRGAIDSYRLDIVLRLAQLQASLHKLPKAAGEDKA